MNHQIPAWIVLHIPHDSVRIPDDLRYQFALSDSELANELLKMTDRHTRELFSNGVTQQHIAHAKVSRLVVDVERFADDTQESMAKAGMGAVYERTHLGCTLRHPITASERAKLIADWYTPHHELLTKKVENALVLCGKCLIVDCHSFASVPLPHEPDQSPDRPQFCIGTDEFHTPTQLSDYLIHALQREGYTARKDIPFDDALVPMEFYKRDKRVSSVMIEVRRDLYMNEATGEKTCQFMQISQTIHRLLAGCASALPI